VNQGNITSRVKMQKQEFFGKGIKDEYMNPMVSSPRERIQSPRSRSKRGDSANFY
jgi:hypothetical protein